MRFTLKQIQHAEALAHHRNFREAANALCLTQPALTRSIQSLESNLGVEFFDRLATGVEPTKAGYMFLERARQLLAQSLDMEQELSALLGLEAGSFTLATGPYPGDYLVPEALARLISQHPNITYRLFERDWNNVTTMVLKHEIELAVADLTGASDDPRLETEVLIDSPLLYTCRGDHPLANRHNVPMEDIGKFPLVGNSTPPRMVDYLSSPARAESFTIMNGVLRPKIEVDTFAAARRILLSSHAVSLVPTFLVQPDLDSGALTFIDTEPVPLRMNSGFISLAGRTKSSAAIRFMEEARAVKRLMDERTTGY